MGRSYCCHRWLWSSRAQVTTAWWAAPAWMAPLALPCLLLAAAAAAWPPCLPPAAATAACLPCSGLLGGARRRGQGRGRWQLLGLNQLCLHHDTGAGRVDGTLLRLALHHAAAGKQEQRRDCCHSCIRQGFQPFQALHSLPAHGADRELPSSDVGEACRKPYRFIANKSCGRLRAMFSRAASTVRWASH